MSIEFESARGYRPGVCNIGPAEIARRRRSGHIGSLTTIALFLVLVLTGAPPVTRLLLILPAGGAAAGYLPAWFRFCLAFGSRGVFNFDGLGEQQDVVDTAARATDRARSIQIGIAGLAIGVLVGLIAVALPLPT
jgi:hypothetical protein